MKCLQTRRQLVATKVAPAPCLQFSQEWDFQFIATRQPKESHPDEEDLEEFLFGRLPECQRQNIESHLHACDSCSERLIALADFIRVLRKAMGMHELCETWPQRWE
jgi:hypothetical protein